MSTKISLKILCEHKKTGRNGMIMKPLKRRTFPKDIVNLPLSKFCWSSEYLDQIELLMEWRDLLLILTKVINLSSLLPLTLIKSSKHQMRNLQSFSSFPLELILYLMFRIWQLKKVLQGINLNICRWGKACKKKLIFIFLLQQPVAIGWCFKIAIFWLLGWRTIWRSFWKLYPSRIKISDSGSQPNRLKHSHSVSFKRHWKWSLNHQMDSDLTWDQHFPS